MAGLEDENVILSGTLKEVEEKNAELLDQGLAAYSTGFERAKMQAQVLAPALPMDQFDEAKVVLDGVIVDEPEE